MCENCTGGWIITEDGGAGSARRCEYCHRGIQPTIEKETPEEREARRIEDLMNEIAEGKL